MKIAIVKTTVAKLREALSRYDENAYVSIPVYIRNQYFGESCIIENIDGDEIILEGCSLKEAHFEQDNQWTHLKAINMYISR
jgi:hypothetical protein